MVWEEMDCRRTVEQEVGGSSPPNCTILQAGVILAGAAHLRLVWLRRQLSRNLTHHFIFLSSLAARDDHDTAARTGMIRRSHTATAHGPLRSSLPVFLMSNGCTMNPTSSAALPFSQQGADQ
jgi:hypothetical protein